MELVLASNNPGKAEELSRLLAESGIRVLPQSEFRVPEAEETGQTFVENALIKARNATACSGRPALADDSGLCVDALEGAPGVRSARFAGPEADDAANRHLLLEQLRGETRRSARFVCVVVCIRHAYDPLPLIAQGEWHGRIGEEERGSGGFGYDPVFLPDEAPAKTAAELAPAEKDRLSHRGRALEGIRDRLPELLQERLGR